MEVPQKFKDGSTTGPRPSSFTSGDLSEDDENTDSESCRHPYAHFSVVHKSEAMETTKASVGK